MQAFPPCNTLIHVLLENAKCGPTVVSFGIPFDISPLFIASNFFSNCIRLFLPQTSLRRSDSRGLLVLNEIFVTFLG